MALWGVIHIISYNISATPKFLQCTLRRLVLNSSESLTVIKEVATLVSVHDM